MDLHYFTFMGRNLENRIKLMSIRIMNSLGMNNMNIVHNVNICSGSVVVNSIIND
jgi:hypothetical protein